MFILAVDACREGGMDWYEPAPEGPGDEVAANPGSEAVEFGPGLRPDGTAAVGRSRPDDGTGFDWRDYTRAVRRWERLIRRAPSPTHIGERGGRRLSPWFVEWMQGLPEGHLVAVPGVTREEAIKAAGNGVVPQQATEALRRLLLIAKNVSAPHCL